MGTTTAPRTPLVAVADAVVLAVELVGYPRGILSATVTAAASMLRTLPAGIVMAVRTVRSPAGPATRGATA